MAEIRTEEHPNAALLQSATAGFDYLFSNDVLEAKKHFTGKDDPFHLLGLGVCAFLEAALGMESGLMTEATRCLSLSEAEARKHQKAPKSKSNQRFPPGTEWEILNADAVVLLGLTHALSESYMGYFQCMYSLNSAHSKFTKLYKSVFPNGLDAYVTPATSPAPSRKSSNPSIRSAVSVSKPATPTKSFFGRWAASSGSAASLAVPQVDLSPAVVSPDGPVEELIIAGTAFGFGLFNLVFSLLPKKIQSLVGFFGFKHDRKLALQALAVSAMKKDVHGVFAGLVLMTYHGAVLLLSGYQADEAYILKQYKAIVDSIESRYPEGALWILNRAKILRMSHDATGAIRVLQEGLKPERPHSFAQADTLLIFELAWTLLGERRYQESADMFIKITELNSWSHGTYYFLAAGCYISLGNYTKAQELYDAIPDLIDRKKINGKDLPTEVLIKKKLAFYKEKQIRRGGPEAEYARSIKISTAEELGIFWNTHTRVKKYIAEAHIDEWSALTPPFSSPANSRLTSNKPNTHGTNPISEGPLDLDTPDELALRSLLLGISYRTAGEFQLSRQCLKDALARLPSITVSTWIGGVATFELAVLDLKVVETKERKAATEGGAGLHTAALLVAEWERALVSAGEKLEVALGLATNAADLSSRLDSRIAMLKDEIATKREMLGISA